MRRVVTIFTLLLILLPLTACDDKLTSGEIYSKSYTPAHTQLLMLPYAISAGSSVRIVMLPYQIYHADDWVISISASREGKEVRTTYHVTQEVYDAYEVGDWFVYDKEVCRDEAESSAVPVE